MEEEDFEPFGPVAAKPAGGGLGFDSFVVEAKRSGPASSLGALGAFEAALPLLDSSSLTADKPLGDVSPDLGRGVSSAVEATELPAASRGPACVGIFGLGRRAI
jgi:hypothetical protein